MPKKKQEEIKFKDEQLKKKELERIKEPHNKDILSTGRKVLRLLAGQNSSKIEALKKWVVDFSFLNQSKYSSKLYNESFSKASNIKEIKPTYDDSKKVDGRIILRNNFDKLLGQHENLLIFGEDSGKFVLLCFDCPSHKAAQLHSFLQLRCFLHHR